MSCFIHPDELAKPRLPAGVPRNIWLVNRTLRNMNAGSRAIPAALTQQHIVVFVPRLPDLICPTCLIPILHKNLSGIRNCFHTSLIQIPDSCGRGFQIVEDNLKIVKKKL